MKTPRYPVIMAGLVLFTLTLAAAAPRVAEVPVALDLQAEGVAAWLAPGSTEGAQTTGSALFDKEWAFGTFQMAALGFGQHAATHADSRALDIERMDRCIERVISEEGRAFDRGSWGHDPLADLESSRGHIAWYGYTNLVLSSRRALDPGSPSAGLNDQLSSAILRRLEADLLPETYPGERYPVDVSAAVASVGLWARATGQPEPAILATWRAALADRWMLDGLLIQSADTDGVPRDLPRGSGTFLASWFLSFWDAGLGASLYTSGRDHLFTEMGPLSAMREYPRGISGNGDIDSGPIVAGMGVSATGFAIGAARAAGDVATAEKLESTARLIGRPTDEGGQLHWQTGAALGSAPLSDAILFAMMSTPQR
ncbi:hypothetical protein LBMAG42_31860 [Deltaproteobacteria bacterium]|nr:hypothetical protein LBMAG42_31860 [Deltaproteobacteria bacterium]